MDESGTDIAKFHGKVVSWRKVAGAIRDLVNALGLQLECARVLLEGLLVPVLLCCGETMIWREKDKSKIRAVQVVNLRGLLGIRRMDRVPNVQIRELCGLRKRVDERIDDCLAILKEWRIIRLLKGVYGRVCG